MLFKNKDYKLIPVLKKDVCSPSLMSKIRRWALSSLYRMNAKSSDCYAFNIKDNDWDGGWDWSNTLIDEQAEYVIMLDSLKVFKIIKL